MKTEPLATALREITETKVLLESLLISSECFDYPKAKLACKALQQKVRDLRRLQTSLEKQRLARQELPSNVHILDFTQPLQPSKPAPR